MRFSNIATDIPDRLVALQEKGEVIFLCGAGISQRYGLPSFYKLTTSLYADLGESWTGYPAEEDAMGVDQAGAEKGAPALDRAIFALAKRLRGTDTGSRIRAEALLTKAVEDNLQPPAGPFEAHENVWTLSRDAEMRRRIITTNFDTLFERAAGGSTESRACADLPPPLGTDFTGVLHLHGRITDTELGLSRTPLVLNSAEFGEAYLRSGWAARYIYDLARATTIVILGYGADDPPMRYILEVLTADRERYPDIREIFAFVPTAPDPTSRSRATAIWDAKGATAITYDSSSPADHDHLYRTLSQWAGFAADPTGWRRAEATRILRQDPDALQDDDLALLKWLLSGGDAGELLGKISPDPHWAKPLKEADVFRSPDVSPVPWIFSRLADRNMPSAAAAHLPLTEHTVAAVERLISWRISKNDQLHPVLAKAWRLIVQVASRRLSGSDDTGLKWMRVKASLKDRDFSLSTKRDLIDCLRPRMGLGHVFRWPELENEPTPDTLALRHVLRIEWGPRRLGRTSELTELWPSDQRPELIRALSRQLEDALEEAADTDTLRTANHDVRSVSHHNQDQYSDGFYPIVRMLADLWDADNADHPAFAKALAEEWLSSSYLLLRRLGLHGLRQPLFSAIEVTGHLLAVSDEDFWLGDARREIMQVFAHRWQAMPAEQRLLVETRICQGMPRRLLVADGDAEQVEAVRSNAVFIRLSRIEETTGELSPPAVARLRELRETYPTWLAESEKDDFQVWSSGARTVGRQGDVSLLAATPPEDLLARVEEVVGRDPFAQGDLWRLYCDADPQKALTVLLTSDPNGTARSGAWQSFLWSITANDDVAIQQATLEAIGRKDFSFAPYTAIADWLLRKREGLNISTAELLELWDRLFEAIADKAAPVRDQSRQDVVFSMLNSAEGKIGTLLLNEYGRSRAPIGGAEQPAILQRIERLLGADGELGFLGTAAIMDGLPALFAYHEKWAARVLIPLTAWSSHFAAAAWSVILGGRVPQHDLYAALKKSLFEAGHHPELGRSLESVAQWLVAPLLWAQEPNAALHDVNAVEVRTALARSNDEVRQSAAYWLSSAMEQLQGQRGDIWRQRIGPLLRQIWPIDPASRSKGASLHLLRLALLTDDAFPDAAEAIAPALAPLEPWEIDTYLSPEEDAKPFYIAEPASVLAILHAVVAEDGVPASLITMLETLAAHDGSLRTDIRFIKLLGWARRQAAPLA